jgi:hypothetical protein
MEFVEVLGEEPGAIRERIPLLRIADPHRLHARLLADPPAGGLLLLGGPLGRPSVDAAAAALRVLETEAGDPGGTRSIGLLLESPETLLLLPGVKTSPRIRALALPTRPLTADAAALARAAAAAFGLSLLRVAEG